MDDGYAWSFGFATECFTLAEVKLLAAAHQANFGQHNSTIPRRPPSVVPERVSRRLRSPCLAPPVSSRTPFSLTIEGGGKVGLA